MAKKAIINKEVRKIASCGKCVNGTLASIGLYNCAKLHAMQVDCEISKTWCSLYKKASEV